jgi:hypothetical protein
MMLELWRTLTWLWMVVLVVVNLNNNLRLLPPRPVRQAANHPTPRGEKEVGISESFVQKYNIRLQHLLQIFSCLM